MPVLKDKELRIVGFLCNWCSYGGADTAGVARATQPTDLRIIRVPCTGRVDPLFVLKALFGGADGVLVSGCHPRDCHYSVGNYYARRRLEVIKRFLPILGIDDRRFEYTWVSASEGQRWQEVVTDFTARIHKLGQAPRLADASPMLKIAELALSSLHALGSNLSAPLDELKAAIIGGQLYSIERFFYTSLYGLGIKVAPKKLHNGCGFRKFFGSWFIQQGINVCPERWIFHTVTCQAKVVQATWARRNNNIGFFPCRKVKIAGAKRGGKFRVQGMSRSRAATGPVWYFLQVKTKGGTDGSC